MSSANSGGKFRSLKGFLSSTRNLNQSGESQRYKSHHQLQSDQSSSIITTDNKKNSVSLFDLVDPPLNSSRPNSMCLSQNGFAYKSVSTYGLSQRDMVDENRDSVVQRSGSTSKNPAVRLYQTIRAKFMKRRRDSRNKIVTSKSDFGPYIPSNKNSESSAKTSTGNDTSNNSTTWFEQENSISTSHPRSLHNLHQVDLLEDTFMKPFGYRDNDVKKDEFTASPTSPSPRNGNNNKSALAASSPNLNNVCQEPSTSSSGSILKGKVDTGAPLRSKALTAELCDLLHYGWYWGGLSKDEAEEKLKTEPDGAFVVRDSSSDHYLLSLSFNSNGKTLHTRIEYRNGLFCFYSSETECFASVAELIEYWIATSQEGAFCYIKSRRTDVPSYPVRLVQPVSRFTEVKSLKYLSRFVIRQYVRLDLIPQLPLPQTLISFIGQQRYI